MKIVENQKGFGLIILILVIAIIGVSFGAYFSVNYRNAVEKKKQAEEQKEQIEKQVNEQLEQFEEKINDVEQKIPSVQN